MPTHPRLVPLTLWMLAAAFLVLGCQTPAPDDAPQTTQHITNTTSPTTTGPTATTTPKPTREKKYKDLVPEIPAGADLGVALGPVSANLDLGQPADISPELQKTLAKVYTEPGEIPRLKLNVDGKPYELPLKHTHVKAEIAGGIARVEVTQTYQNPFTYPIETTYVFPLPENSAVDDMKMVIGDRVIQAEIQERAQAQATYDAAKAQGKTAALLEQERPNIFTQSVANIAPLEDIDVVVRYVQDLTYDAGEYEFVFPMVVGPRFIPGNPTDAAPSGTGWAKDTDAVRDASRISPPLVGGGMRAGQDISLELIANPGFPIQSWETPTHDTSAEVKDGKLDLMLAEKNSIPNRDFILRYKVGAPDMQASLLAHKGDRGGFFALMIQPPAMDLDASVGQREMIFVVDISGSMIGRPLSLCKDAMVQALRNLRPTDTFNVVTFASGEKVLFEKPRPANDTNIKDGLDFIAGLNAGGGTMMGLGVQAALSPPIEKGRNRYVFFMTDGMIGGEQQIYTQTADLLTKQREAGAKARVFSVGAGPSLNTELLTNIAKAGDGTYLIVSNREDPSRAVNTFFRYVDKPIIEDVVIDWGGLDVSETMPPVMPDLFASRALMIYGRYNVGGSATIKIKGKRDGKDFEMPLTINLPADTKGAEVLTTLWARARIDDLRRDQWDGENATAKSLITKLGIDFHLVTEYTSLVAVDHSRTVGDGDPTHITQPADLPEGMDANIMDASKSYKKAASVGVAKPPSQLQSIGMLGGGGGKTKISGRPLVAAKFSVDDGSSYSGATIGSHQSGSLADLGGGGKVGNGDERLYETSSAKPQLKPADPTVGGNFDKQIIKRIVNQKKAEITQCYNKELQKDPALKGKITIKWTITPDGHVEKIEIVSNELKNDAIAACLTGRIAVWRFPNPKAGASVEVSYPFNFDSSK